MPEYMTTGAGTTTGAGASAVATFQQGSDALRQQIEQQVQQQIQQAQQEAARARQDAANQLRRRAEAGADQEGVAFRVDPGGRIIQLDGAPGIAGVAQTLPPPLPGSPEIPPGAVTMALAFFIMLAVIAIGVPIARAIARRIDRAPAPGARPSAEQSEQLRQIQTAVDAMAVEIERVSENQRFVTRLLTEGSGPEGQLLARQLGARVGQAPAAAAPRTDER
ncbi:MAG TPA: hypothetical protein VF048_08165 [Gemmatimonadaceae bacterium]